mgnify:CR=1 FL=1
MTRINKFSIKETKGLFKGPWDPKDVVEYAGLVLKVAKFEGKYGEKPHTHEYDEFFLVLEGEIRIYTEDGEVSLEMFEGVVIPSGLPHQPFAEKPALVLMLDPKEQP